MDETDLLGVSARERALYAELLGVYRELLAAIDDESADALVERRARAEAITKELRMVAEMLAPHRLSGAAVTASVRALWSESAETAVEALGANAELTKRARSSAAAVAGALLRVREGRSGLAGYRPAGAGVARIADRHA